MFGRCRFVRCSRALPFCAESWGSGGAVLGRGRSVVENPGGLGGGVAVLCKILGGWRGCFGALPFCAKSLVLEGLFLWL